MANIIVNYDQQNDPASFKGAIQQAVNILDSVILDPITVTIQVGYGEFGQYLGSPFTPAAMSNGSAGATYAASVTQTYSQLRADLASHETSADDIAFVNSLPNTASLNGVSTFTVPYAEARALGLVSSVANGVIDGAAGFATDIPQGDLVGVALHELTHALGRVPGATLLSLMRYTGIGQHDFAGNLAISPTTGKPIPTPASYLSFDGGYTKLADFGQDSDPSDFLNPASNLPVGAPASNLTPSDPFNEYYVGSTIQALSALDLRELDALGFHIRTSTTTPAPHHTPGDFNGDGIADILWRNSNGALADWSMNGSSIASSQLVNAAPGASWSIAETADFNGDGHADVLWRDSATGSLVDWTMNGGTISASQALGAAPDASWNVAGAGDFNGDGKADILWRNANGALADWTMNGGTITNGQLINTAPDASWNIAGIGDFNGDGKADILWRNTNGALAVWTMNGASIASGQLINAAPDASWSVAGVGDFNGDGKADILWRNSNGTLAEWLMNGSQIVSSGLINAAPDSSWSVVETGDFNGDGKTDLLWRQSGSGLMAEWQMNGTTIASSQLLQAAPDGSWQTQSHPTNFA
jgi:hypothetical protein